MGGGGHEVGLGALEPGSLRDVAYGPDDATGGVVAESGGRVDVGALPTIDADASQIRQLLQNLLGNAIKFRRPGVPPVVAVDAASSRDGDVTITVTDNGIGFKSEHGERIFRMFERLHARTVYAGSGIGLAVCRKIVERHGGTIVATSTIGQGTTFCVTLPTTQADAGATP